MCCLRPRIGNQETTTLCGGAARCPGAGHPGRPKSLLELAQSHTSRTMSSPACGVRSRCSRSHCSHSRRQRLAAAAHVRLLLSGRLKVPCCSPAWGRNCRYPCRMSCLRCGCRLRRRSQARRRRATAPRDVGVNRVASTQACAGESLPHQRRWRCQRRRRCPHEGCRPPWRRTKHRRRAGALWPRRRYQQRQI